MRKILEKNLDDKKRDFEKERRKRGFIPNSLINLIVLKSVENKQDVVDIWIEFLEYINNHWGVDNWIVEDSDLLEDWFESYAIRR